MSTAELHASITSLLKDLSADRLQEVYDFLVHSTESRAAQKRWNQLPEQRKKAIEDGLSQLNRGEGIAHKDVMENFRKTYGLEP